jgi:D-glycero-alpha-D-manno-heptose-7-phosphate kinase
VRVTPVALSDGCSRGLCNRLLLFSTGLAHDSAAILRHQRAETGSSNAVVASLHRIKELGHEMRAALERGDLDGFGELLDRGWQEKRRLSGRISSAQIDEWYAAARAAGAIGGKITGAGGGGFLLLYCPTERQEALRAAMARAGLRELPFAFDTAGASVVGQATNAVGNAQFILGPPASSRHVLAVNT